MTNIWENMISFSFLTVSAQMEHKNAVDCLSALIKYLNILEDNANCSKYRLETFVFDQYLRLDVAAVKALELFDASYGSKKFVLVRSYFIRFVFFLLSLRVGQKYFIQFIK